MRYSTMVVACGTGILSRVTRMHALATNRAHARSHVVALPSKRTHFGNSLRPNLVWKKSELKVHVNCSLFCGEICNHRRDSTGFDFARLLLGV